MNPNEYEAMFRAEQKHWWYRALHRLIFDWLGRELPGWKDKAILDAGCGTGAILERLGNPGRNVGVDLAPEALAFCRQRGLENVRQADISALPFPDNSFDAVICSSVLYHQWVGDVPRALREINRVLRPDGILLVNLPAFSFLHSAHDDSVMTARRFRKSEVLSLLARNGFKIRRLSYWTTLLFPMAVAARMFALLKSGRDFESGSKPVASAILGGVMTTERALLRLTDLPFGVALMAMARKAP
jgi:SAM-dependent methyltransferase